NLLAVYYDTIEQDLRNTKVALRIRKENGKYIQTFKASVVSASEDKSLGAAISRRVELNFPVLGTKLDLDLLRGDPDAEEVFRNIEISNLKPVFETHVRRTIRDIHFGSSIIEMAIDSGEIIAGDKVAPIHEVELELIKGNEEEIYTLSELLAGRFSFKQGGASKAARGYMLANLD
ncbi:MAG: CYTH domain-containing protein, partial [Alphaproteobacteria bacterium]|nr:CYTH domain-containing protein [Alphaproteobacteria bacterium]